MKTKLYTMHGRSLFDSLHRRVAYIQGKDIYDCDNRRVATIRDNILFDSYNRMMMTVRGDYIYDASNKRVASLLDSEEKIEGSEKGMQSIALWYCFIR